MRKVQFAILKIVYRIMAAAIVYISLSFIISWTAYEIMLSGLSRVKTTSLLRHSFYIVHLSAECFVIDVLAGSFACPFD